MGEGWAKPWRAQKFHYFVDGRSLCRAWGMLGNEELEQDTGKTQAEDDCARCARAMEKRRAG